MNSTSEGLMELALERLGVGCLREAAEALRKKHAKTSILEGIDSFDPISIAADYIERIETDSLSDTDRQSRKAVLYYWYCMRIGRALRIQDQVLARCYAQAALDNEDPSWQDPALCALNLLVNDQVVEAQDYAKWNIVNTDDQNAVRSLINSYKDGALFGY